MKHCAETGLSIFLGSLFLLETASTEPFSEASTGPEETRILLHGHGRRKLLEAGRGWLRGWLRLTRVGAALCPCQHCNTFFSESRRHGCVSFFFFRGPFEPRRQPLCLPRANLEPALQQSALQPAASCLLVVCGPNFFTPPKRSRLDLCDVLARCSPPRLRK